VIEGGKEKEGREGGREGGRTSETIPQKGRAKVSKVVFRDLGIAWV
jgi:hypothetical protein